MAAEHAAAVVKLLSALANDDLEDIGMTPDEVWLLHEVWETSCDEFEKVTGSPHPLSAPTDADDATMPDIIVVTHAGNNNVH